MVLPADEQALGVEFEAVGHTVSPFEGIQRANAALDYEFKFKKGNPMKYVSLLCLSLVALTGASHAVEPEMPNMVGTWKASTGVYTRTGTESKKAAPVLSQQPLQAEIKFVEQKGRVFHGVVKGANGLVFHMAGVLEKDGKSFKISSDRSISTGTFEDGKIEYCGATISRDYNLVFCSTLEKVK